MAINPEDRDRSFIGTGWAFPFGFDPATGGVAKTGVAINQTSALERIKDAIKHIINTHLRERCMRPDFGTGLRSFLFEPNDEALLARARAEVIQKLEDWEPRITITRSNVRQNQQSGLIEIFVEFRVNETNTLENFVFPFYTQEETITE